ncbi:hypothetical protein EMIT0180MI3_80108 [Priestia megaterium]
MSQRLKQYIMGSRGSVNNDKYQKGKGGMERIGMPLSCVCKIVKQYGKISWLKFEALPIFFCLEKPPPVCLL